MRILIQQRKSGLYLKENGAWTRQNVEARDFTNSTAAIEFCVSNQLTDVQLVLKFEEQQYDIVLQISADLESTQPDQRRRGSVRDEHEEDGI